RHGVPGVAQDEDQEGIGVVPGCLHPPAQLPNQVVAVEVPGVHAGHQQGVDVQGEFLRAHLPIPGEKEIFVLRR
ncbi:hypothetical protein AVEN_193902-1, partial [Araneus ventricosus]